MRSALTPRLHSVASLVPHGTRLVDVGTDHAYLPAYLLMTEQISSAIATDIRPGPLARANMTVERYDLQDRLELRLCDGLAGIGADEVDAVTIAGMGGETILGILEAAPWSMEKTCILQPMSAVETLRSGLDRLGITIAKEVLSREGKTIYLTLLLGKSAVKRGPLLSPAETYVGTQAAHIGDPLWPEYLALSRQRAERALAGSKRSIRPEDAQRCTYFEQVLYGITEMMKEDI